MQSSPRPPRVAQLKLFHPPITTPPWGSLPQEVRRHTVQLLARLLRAYSRSLAKEPGEEVRDE